MDSKNSKNRELSAAEYFIQIQKEYLIAQFRSKIYFSPKNKRYWKRVMDYKAEKIKSIATRNKLNSILNSSEKMDEFQHRLFDRYGKPKFQMTPEDVKNYYTAGNEFSYHGEIYTLDAVRSDGKLQLYSLEHQEFEIADKDDVCRIL